MSLTDRSPPTSFSKYGGRSAQPGVGKIGHTHQTLEQGGRQIAFRERRQDDDDIFACHLRAFRNFEAAARAAPDEMPTAKPSSVAALRAIANAVSLPICSTSSINPRSRMAGTNPAPMPWILCGPGAPPDKNWAVFGFNGDDFDVWIASL